VLGVCLAPFAVLFDIDLSLDEFAVLAGPVIDTAALGAGELEKLILRHSERNYTQEQLTSQSQSNLLSFANLTPGWSRLSTHECTHQGVDDKPG
jgi:hypothetical protein